MNPAFMTLSLTEDHATSTFSLTWTGELRYAALALDRYGEVRIDDAELRAHASALPLAHEAGHTLDELATMRMTHHPDRGTFTIVVRGPLTLARLVRAKLRLILVSDDDLRSVPS